ncbi:MAG: ferrous iron transport protein B [Candidatus Omnitrophica bacterium]|nr:ferrous iron transport protein B [Candidatus Omnitrophota bacterium]
MDKDRIDFSHKGAIALVGNPNVGKSVIFNLFTGEYVTVSNYPGTTVEVARGIFRFDRSYSVLDTPGTNSLIPSSEDERVTRDILYKENVKAVVQIIDAKNLKRSLFLTLQLIESGLPLVLALNMMDEAEERRVKIDAKGLSLILGVDVIPTIAIEKTGINNLIHAVPKARVSSHEVGYPEFIEQAIERISRLIPQGGVSKRLTGIMLLSRDAAFLRDILGGVDAENIRQIEQEAAALESRLSGRMSRVIDHSKFAHIDAIIRKVVKEEILKSKLFLERLGNWMVSPLWGGIFALFILFLLYKFVGEFSAGTAVDFLEEKAFGEYFNPWITAVLGRFIPYAFVRDMFIGEYGVITMALTYSLAIILPIVSAFFLAFGILEDTGYLPRLSVVMDKVFRRLGLHGKAVLPMVLGLGCGTMAVLTTRILETKKERLIATVLLALAIPCSAQLGVILGMLAAVSRGAMLIWVAVIAFILLVIGFVMDKAIPGKRSDFIMELPPLRLPKISNILTKLLARLQWYLKEAVPLFMIGTLMLFIFDKLGVLVRIEGFFSPVVQGFLGLPAKATESFIIGFLRRDYGAAGLYALQKDGALTNLQILVSIIVITLFVPCIAQFFVAVKERGLKAGLAIFFFVMLVAVLTGGAVNFIISYLGVRI